MTWENDNTGISGKVRGKQRLKNGNESWEMGHAEVLRPSRQQVQGMGKATVAEGRKWRQEEAAGPWKEASHPILWPIWPEGKELRL